MGKITGRCEVLVNGILLLNKSGAVASGIGRSGEANFELNEVMGDTGIHGFVEAPVLAQLEVTVTDRDDISLDEFARIFENGTVIFRAARGGKVYIMESATCKRNFSITAGEGETTLVFVGPYWTETTEAVIV
jgi:hypothetical protein